MRTRTLASVFPLAVAAIGVAEDMPAGYFRGTMLSWEGTPTEGVLSASDSQNEVFTCRYDSKSFMELDHWRVKVDKLEKGDPVKILAYQRIGETTCSIISLVVEEPPKPVVARPGQRPAATQSQARPSQAKFVRPAVLTPVRESVAGIVTAITDRILTLRTRDGERTFTLRFDTRYLGNGLRMDLADVKVNQRLSVETSETPGGTWEAFQLTWGDLTVR